MILGAPQRRRKGRGSPTKLSRQPPTVDIYLELFPCRNFTRPNNGDLLYSETVLNLITADFLASAEDDSLYGVQCQGRRSRWASPPQRGFRVPHSAEAALWGSPQRDLDCRVNYSFGPVGLQGSITLPIPIYTKLVLCEVVIQGLNKINCRASVCSQQLEAQDIDIVVLWIHDHVGYVRGRSQDQSKVHTLASMLEEEPFRTALVMSSQPGSHDIASKRLLAPCSKTRA